MYKMSTDDREIITLRVNLKGEVMERFLKLKEAYGIENDTELVRILVSQYYKRLEQGGPQDAMEELRDYVKKLEARNVEDRRELQLLRTRLNLIEQAVTGQNKLRDLVKQLDELRE